MSFKPYPFLAVLLVSGCGLLGEKEDSEGIIEYASPYTDCLTDLGDQIKDYSKGEVTKEEWTQSWDCTVDSLNFFQDFVATSDPEGYTSKDIYSLFTNVLGVKKGVEEDTVKALFKLKASLFGGSDQILSKPELKRITRWIVTLRDETTLLLPAVRNRAEKPTPLVLSTLSHQLEASLDRIGKGLSNKDYPPLTQSTLSFLISEFGEVVEWDLRSEDAEAFMATKHLLMGGARDRVSGAEWQKVFRFIGSFGGPLLNFFSLEKADMEDPENYLGFIRDILKLASGAFDQTMKQHGGSVPLPLFDRVITAFPERWAELPISKDVLIGFLRPLNDKILRQRVSGSEGFFTTEAKELLFQKADELVHTQWVLERVFHDRHLDERGESKDRLLRAIEGWDGDPNGEHREPLAYLAWLVTRFRPIFEGNNKQITYTVFNRYSLHNMQMTHAINLAVSHLIGSYSSLPSRDKATYEDFAELLDDTLPVGIDLKLVDHTVPGIANKRFGESDLFTFASNSDDLMDEDEATYYVGIISSIFTLFERVMEDLEPACGVEEWGGDPRGYLWMDPHCLRDFYFGNRSTYWDHFPRLFQFYRELGDDRQFEINQLMESVGRRCGVDDRPWGSYDLESMVGLTHYVEQLFARFDTNGDQFFDLYETLLAFPHYKGLIQKVGNLKPDDHFLSEAAFTFMIRYGEKPETSFPEILKFGAWIAQKPFWKIESDRTTLYSMIAFIKEAITPPDPNGCPPIGLQDSQ